MTRAAIDLNRLAWLAVSFAVLACAPDQTPVASSTDEAAIQAAKSVIASHEAFARAGDLEGIVSNVAEDIVLLAPDAPLVIGRPAFREMYSGLLTAGRWDFVHNYEGAAVTSRIVFLHGIATGSVTSADGQASEFANNFQLILRPDSIGTYKVWRAAFAPGPQ